MNFTMKEPVEQPVVHVEPFEGAPALCIVVLACGHTIAGLRKDYEHLKSVRCYGCAVEGTPVQLPLFAEVSDA